MFVACLFLGGLLHAVSYGTWIQASVVGSIYFIGYLGLKTLVENPNDQKKMFLALVILLLMWFSLQFLGAVEA